MYFHPHLINEEERRHFNHIPQKMTYELKLVFFQNLTKLGTLID